MAKKTVRDIDVAGKRVLVRVDFNVPLKEGRVTDDSRIRAALPTIEYLREQGCRVILMSHLGRPKDAPDPALMLDPVAMRLGQLLGAPVRKVSELSGPGVEAAVAGMKPGDVMLLENSRFDPREKKNDPELVNELARLGDLYVNDAFSAAHRAHATTAGLAAVLPAVAGFQMEKEVAALDGAARRAQAALRGGPGRGEGHRQDQGHRPVPRSGRPVADRRSDGFTFLKAKGLPVGSSKVEEEGVAVAALALLKAAASKCELVLPTDRGGGRRVRRRRGYPGRRCRRYPRRVDGAGHRPGDRDRVRRRNRAGRRGLLERAHGRVRDGAVRRRHSGGGRGHGRLPGRDGRRRRRLGGGRQQVRRGGQDGPRLDGRRGFAGVHRRRGAAGSGEPA